MKRSLALLGARPAQPLPSPASLDALGAPLEAKEIAAKFFQGRVTPRWVLDNVAPDKRLRMGRVIVWYEADVKAWMPSYIAAQQAKSQLKAG